VTDLALARVRERDRDRPLFAWFHYSDPHAPYRFHEKFNPARRALWKMEKVAKTRARYDSEVAYTDYHIGRLLEALPRENLFVIFLADHGESLYEHDYLGHGRRIYQNNVSIPFVIRGPGITPGRSRAPARGIDLAPTLLGLAGLPRPIGMLGLDLLHDEVPADRARVIETYGGAIPNLPGAHSLMASRPPMRQGVLLDEWKLILDGNRAELYHLPTDPLELEDQSRKNEARVTQLRSIVEQWDSATEKGAAEAAELSAEDIEVLKGLGYVQ
jgi:arylsulfatase A-like enzyme